MSAKIQQKTEVAKFTTEKGKLNFNGKTYDDCNAFEKQAFNQALSDERKTPLDEMLERMTIPLIVQFVPPMSERELEKIKPHFV